jgi:hypothetical protein
VQRATNFLSKKVLELIAAGRTFPPVGPMIDEPGGTRFKATLKGHKLRIERLFYVEGAIPVGTTLTCQGGSRDRTTGAILSEVQMIDLLRSYFSDSAGGELVRLPPACSWDILE